MDEWTQIRLYYASIGFVVGVVTAAILLWAA